MSVDDNEVERFMLRVPQDMMAQIRRLAQQHHRSLHDEYLQAVHEYLGRALYRAAPRGTELLDRQQRAREAQSQLRRSDR